MNKLRDLSNPPENTYITRSLPFAATLVTLGFQLKDTVVSSDGDVAFVFDANGEDLQDFYETWHIRDIEVPSRQFCGHWRRLRRLIDMVKS